MTGEGGDILIADDPQNPVHIYKKAKAHMPVNWAFVAIRKTESVNVNCRYRLIVLERKGMPRKGVITQAATC